MKKATLTYASGWKLTFDAHGSGPMLFLEWISAHQHLIRGHKYNRVTYMISKKPQVDEVLNDQFVIRFDNVLRNDAQECRDYINNNS